MERPALLRGSWSQENPVADLGEDSLVQTLSFFRIGERGAPDRSRATAWNREPTTPVTSELLARHHIVLGQIEIHEIRCQKKHDRRIHLVAVHRFPLALEKVGQMDSENVHDSHSRGGRDHGGERLLMWIMAVRGEQDELADACCFP